jgi:hypothetical protein
MSEVWKDVENCDECGGPIDHIEIDMGSRDRIPRFLNIGGIAFAIFGVLFMIFKFAVDEVSRSDGWTIMTLFIIGIMLFIASLLFQVQLAQRAREKAADERSTRKQKKLRARSDGRDLKITTGSLEDRPRRTASKVLIRIR